MKHIPLIIVLEGGKMKLYIYCNQKSDANLHVFQQLQMFGIEVPGGVLMNVIHSGNSWQNDRQVNAMHCIESEIT